MDESLIAEFVFDAVDAFLSAPGSISGVLDTVASVDWNDLGEVTIVTGGGTFRGTFRKLSDVG